MAADDADRRACSVEPAAPATPTGFAFARRPNWARRTSPRLRATRSAGWPHGADAWLGPMSWCWRPPARLSTRSVRAGDRFRRPRGPVRRGADAATGESSDAGHRGGGRDGCEDRGGAIRTAVSRRWGRDAGLLRPERWHRRRSWRHWTQRKILVGVRSFFRDVAGSLLVELWDPPAANRIEVDGSVPFEILVVIRPVVGDHLASLVQRDPRVGEVACGTYRVQHDRRARRIPYAGDHPSRARVDQRSASNDSRPQRVDPQCDVSVETRGVVLRTVLGRVPVYAGPTR